MTEPVILASNRLPASVQGEGADAELIPAGAGGLVAGLGPVHRESGGLWFGVLNAGRNPAIAAQLEERGLVAVPVSEQDARRHYEGYSNGALWPLFHYLQDQVDFTGVDFEAYERVNQAFADAIAERARPDHTIWIHDYHLMLVPAMLRQRLPRARIGFFLHIPFPSSEVFRLLPQRDALLHGLLGANLIGVHTYDYARHLVSSFRRILAVDFDQRWTSDHQHRTRVDVFPMGIDVFGYRKRIESPEVERHATRLKENFDGRRIVLSVDRLDYTKGIPQRLEAIRRLLELRPNWRTEAVFVQIANPTRSALPSYQRLKQQVEQMVGEINGRFETDGRVPIHYLYRSFPPEELAAHYAVADVAVISPLRDGMNLVAKEYVSCRSEDSGVLLLSEFAGAASEMGEAIMVNPWNTEAFSRALDDALRMTADEQANRMHVLRRRIVASDVRRWVSRFLDTLNSIASADDAETRNMDRLAWKGTLRLDVESASRVFLILDLDDLLRGRGPTEAALPTPEHVRGLLARLASHPAFSIALVSGLDRHRLDEWLGDCALTVSAEHGFALRTEGSSEWQSLMPGADLSWMRPLREVLDEYAARTSGAWVDVRPTSLSWHYGTVEPGFGGWQARELANHLTEAFQQSPIEVIHDSRTVEVRHQGLGKGTALRALLRRFHGADLVIIAGDSRGSEEMFEEAPPEAWTIRAGSRRTRARRRLADAAELLELLEGFTLPPRPEAGNAPAL